MMAIPRDRLLRVLDANINRAREGLRVCEDVVRFCLSAPDAKHERGRRFRSHVQSLRVLRHALDAAVRGLPVKPLELARARDSRRDPGRRFASSSVESIERLLLINLQRAKEALRVLEESCRVVAPRSRSHFQHLRFRAYDVERHLLIALAALRHH
ncbi:MAG: hypothetical protein HYZ89_02975 [Candidatus Omnitrophica bacterium]|nr:hypothetical protein [Candidatus Omnitrophota bacterium]